MGVETMSALVDRAIAEAGLLEILDARRAGDLARVSALAPLLRTADLLAVGALADRIRADEVGDRVGVFAGVADEARDVLSIGADEAVPGEGRADVLRRVACARVVGPRAARVRVDWASTGIELAQVALGFGANELAGPVLDRRGLPILSDSTKKVKGAGLVSSQLLKKKELSVLVRMAGRVPVFARDARPTAAEGGTLEHA
jgi:2-iminoacetate synthase ThiH